MHVIVQLIAKRDDKYSLSCNPDLTLDLAESTQVIGVVHPALPFMGGDAEVEASFFAGNVESAETQHQLFALPRSPFDLAEHW